MNVATSDCATQMVIIGVEPGEMLLETIERVIEEQDIKNGAVVSGIGTLKTCTMHYIRHTRFPPDDTCYTLEKPLELLSINGIIANYKPHLHIVVSYGEKEVYAGHLEHNCEVAYLAEVAIQKFNALELARKPHATSGKIKLLGPA